MAVKGHSTNFRQHPGPALSLKQARASWFVLDDLPCAVATCSTSEFKRFARRHVPKGFKDQDTLALLRQNALDLCERWYILCALRAARTALYSTQNDAEQAIEQALQSANQSLETHTTPLQG
jgi:hypothetical protein